MTPDVKLSGPYGGLKPEQIEAFWRDGYLIIPNALPPTTTQALLDETHTMLEDFSLDDHPMTKFSTGESSASSSRRTPLTRPRAP
ncbi:hypothetical protein G7054_g15033 [Neopestalotiopsis clavispora]|nr:hypothetical protein G7054_g15033 [Neopestalotiopsis clavispora]